MNYHMICLCYENGTYDCSRNILGPVYPGQVLQLGLCTPCSDNTFIFCTQRHLISCKPIHLAGYSIQLKS